jgi:hypothetical protein
MACDNINWSTFTFIAGTGQTLVSATELTGLNGTATFDAANREISYELGTVNCLVDLIQFQVEDNNGNISNIGTWYVDTADITAPTLSGDSTTVASGSNSVLNVNSNDTGNINLTSYEVVTQPSKVKLLNNLNGTFTIISPLGTEGADSFTYKAATPEGIYGAAATVNITIQNAGIGTSANICPVAGVDLTSYLTGDVTAGGSWTADAGNPSSPSIAVPTSVDFSAATAGVYNFTYTVGSSSATITLILLDYGVTINTVSTPTSNPVAASITTQVAFTTVGVDNINNIQIEVDFNSGTSFDYYAPDRWDASTGFGVITVTLGSGAGTYDIEVSATDSCGTSQTDTASTITLS